MSDEPQHGDEEPEPERERDWVETIARAAGALGLNEVRVRWRLARLQNRWRLWRRRAEQKADHIRYVHKTCPHCSAVQDRDEKTCTVCGESLGARRWQVLRRLGLQAPVIASMSTLLGVSFVLIYGLMILESGGGGVLSLPGPLLYEWGANFTPAVEIGEYWRWATACFLHAGLWHLGFNLIALAIIGPSVEELYGRFQLLFVFLVTGIVASIGSGAMGLYGVGIGASGGLMGLVGLVAGWGQRDGTARGLTARNQMLKWAAYVMVFGFVIGADNWAHGFGLVAGGLLGYGIKPEWLRLPKVKPVAWVTGAIGALGCLGTVALIITGVPSDNRFSKSGDQMAAEQVQAEVSRAVTLCELASSDPDRAIESLSERKGAKASAGDLAEFCEALEALRGFCVAAREQGYDKVFQYPDDLPPNQRRRAISIDKAQCAAVLGDD